MTSGGDSPLAVAQRSIQRSAEMMSAYTLDPQAFLDEPDPVKSRLPDSRLADRIGWFGVGFVALVLLPTWPLASLGLLLTAVLVRIARKVAQNRSEARRLVADADRQHAAILAGADVLGIYGRYPCPTIDPPAAASAEAAALSSTLDSQGPAGAAAIKRLADAVSAIS